MSEPKAPIPPYCGTEYFTLDFNLTPQPCTKEEWLRWTALAVDLLLYTRVESVGIRTEFPGFRHAGGHFFKTVSYGYCGGYVGKADTYEEAMVVHEQVCERVRRCLAEQRQEQAEEAAAYQVWRVARQRLDLPRG